MVSVVIPMHNAEPWIRATVESVVRQTYARDNIELIVVDDQSTDASAAIVRELIEEHGLNGRIVPHDTNGGSGGPRNAGWREATGEWIQFLDADDLLAPGKLAL